MPKSSPPRSVSLGDNIRGFSVLIVYFAILILSVVAGFDDQGALKAFSPSEEMPMMLLALVVVGGFLGIVTAPQAIAAAPLEVGGESGDSDSRRE